MSEVGRGGTNRGIRGAGGAGRIERAGGRRGREFRVHEPGLPDRLRDRRNRVPLRSPLLVGVTGSRRVVGELGRGNRGHRGTVVRRSGRFRLGASNGHPQQGGPAERDEHHASHRPIVTGRDPVAKTALETHGSALDSTPSAASAADSFWRPYA